MRGKWNGRRPDGRERFGKGERFQLTLKVSERHDRAFRWYADVLGRPFNETFEAMVIEALRGC